jgi:hypothetical protein
MHCRFIVRCGGLDGERGCTARKEPFSKDGILDQKEQVGGVAPRFGLPMREPQPVLKERPRRPTILTVGIRIPRRQTAGNGAAHGIINEQALTTRLDEWQRGEPLHGVAWRRLQQERVEKRLGHATDDGTGFECETREGIGDSLDVGTGQRLE